MTSRNRLDFTLSIPPNFGFTPLSTADQENLLRLNPSDTWWNGAVIPLGGIINRSTFWLKEFFSRTKNDCLEFNCFYERIKLNITDLTHKIRRSEDLDQSIPAAKTLLTIHARIANSAWGSNLKNCLSSKYIQLKQDIQTLQNEAQGKAVNWARHDPQNRNEIVRWMHANESQRRFAAYCNLEKVPYRFEEIPAGAVLLTHSKSFHIGTMTLKDVNEDLLTTIASIVRDLYRKVRGLCCLLATGKIYDHAELSLGSGQSFDLIKDNSRTLQMALQQRTGKTCYSDILSLDKEKMLAAHKARFPNTSLTTFDALWAAIDHEARSNVDKIKASHLDIIGTVLSFSKRPSDYDCTKAWAPGEKSYACSGNISALFSKFGIDIGEEFDKVDRKITPADLARSKFFSPLFLADDRST